MNPARARTPRTPPTEPPTTTALESFCGCFSSIKGAEVREGNSEDVLEAVEVCDDEEISEEVVVTCEDVVEEAELEVFDGRPPSGNIVPNPGV